MTFVVNKVVLGQDFLRVLRFPRVIFVDILLLPEGQTGKHNSHVLSEIGKHLIEKCFHFPILQRLKILYEYHNKI